MHTDTVNLPNDALSTRANGSQVAITTKDCECGISNLHRAELTWILVGFYCHVEMRLFAHFAVFSVMCSST